MKRFYLFKDGVQKGRMETRAEALEMIRLWQSRETHSFLRSSASLRGRRRLSPIPPTRNRPGRKGAWSDKGGNTTDE